MCWLVIQSSKRISSEVSICIFSGIEEKNLENAEKFETVQKEVADIILGRIVVGHGLSYGLKALYLTHPRRDLRDTAR